MFVLQYACRKTLADSRPRVRGRFAKNDEVGEPLVKHENKDEDEEEVGLFFCFKCRFVFKNFKADFTRMYAFVLYMGRQAGIW